MCGEKGEMVRAEGGRLRGFLCGGFFSLCKVRAQDNS